MLHLAGMMGVWRPMQDYRDVNVTGTRNVCRAALAAGVSRIVHVSSWTVYGMDLGRPAREDFLLRPFREPYAVSKAEGDLAVQRMIAEDQLPAVILRPGTFFGPGDRLHFGRMADRVRAGKGVIVGRGDNALPFAYVTDIVQGLLLALDCEHAVGQAYNITQRRAADPAGVPGGDRPGARRQPADPPRAVPRALPRRRRRRAAVTVQRSQQQPIVTRLGVKLFGTDNRHAIDKAQARTRLSRRGSRSARAYAWPPQWYLAQGEPAPNPRCRRRGHDRLMSSGCEPVDRRSRPGPRRSRR